MGSGFGNASSTKGQKALVGNLALLSCMETRL